VIDVTRIVLLRELSPHRKREPKFQSVDWYVKGRLTKFLLRRTGRHLRASRVTSWTPEWFREQGLYRLSWTVRYARAA
jgi:hypothetical protein